MVVRFIIILIVALLAIMCFQYLFQNKKSSGRAKKKKSFNSVKKKDVKDADFEELE